MLFELKADRAAFSGSVLTSEGATLIACIAELGTLTGLVAEANNGNVTIEFGPMAAATAPRHFECVARTD